MGSRRTRGGGFGTSTQTSTTKRRERERGIQNRGRGDEAKGGILNVLTNLLLVCEGTGGFNNVYPFVDQYSTHDYFTISDLVIHLLLPLLQPLFSPSVIRDDKKSENTP